MNIIVTGGAGYIGSHVVTELVAAGHRPIIIDNFSNSEESVIDNLKSLTGQDITFYKANFADVTTLEEIITKENVEGVIHIAAFKAVGESVEQPLKYYDNNLCGFVELLKVANKHNIKHFVFSSSAAVYGTPPVAQVTEETPCAPASPYGWTKYMDEIVLRDTCAATPALRGVALRYFNVVGAHPSGKIGELPKGKPQNLLPIIVQVVAGKLPPLTVYGTDYDTADGSCERDYIHVVDLAKAHVAALEKISKQSEGGFEVYNIGTGKPTSVLQMIDVFEKTNGVKVPHAIGERRAGDPAAYFAVADKAEKELGWHATKDLEDGVKSAWEWQKSLG
ncbi:MAG TPA: UDP-glucose 4-epimerase GalE [Candidatus Saccharimonadales bacterium]